MSSTKKILVTGGAGAVGSPLVQELRNRGHDVYIVDRMHSNDPQYFRCDVSEFRQLERIFDEHQFEMVYHLAAEFGRENGEDYYETLWKSNAVGTKNMLRMQEGHGFRMIFTSSSEIYGDFGETMEESVPSRTPIRQLNDYAISKWVNELQIANSRERFGTETVILRLFNTYGPGEYYSPYRSAICVFVYRALHHMPYSVYVKHHRTSSFVDDTIRTMANAADLFKNGEVYNISGDKYHSMKDVSDRILEELRLDDSMVQYVEYEPHNTINKKSDNSRARRDLGHRCTVGLEEGIRRTIKWQKEVYKVS